MRLSFLFACATGLLACGDGTKPKTETETHFLRLCEGSCGAGLSCICGVCTEACTETSACAKLNPNATCAPTPDTCDSTVGNACDMTCTVDAECDALGAGFGCNDGYCRAAIVEGGAAGQGGSGGGASASGEGSGGSGDPEAYSVTLEATDMALCPGECATLQATVANGVEPLRYAWSGTPAGTDTSEIEVCPSGSTTYEVTVTDSRSSLGEFGGDDQQAAASLEVTVDAADCGLPSDEVLTTCELQIPYVKGDGISSHSAIESQAMMTTDAQGNAFLVGSIHGTVTVGDLTATSAGFTDGFVLKLNANCEPQWFITFGGADGMTGLSAVATTDDAIFVGGSFTGTVDFGDGMAVSAERDSIVVLKLDTSGELIWRRSFLSAGFQSVAMDLGVTDSGDVLFSGYTGPDIDFGGGAIGGVALGSTGMTFVARLSGDGDHRYSYAMRGAFSHGPIAVHGSGLVAVSAATGGDVEIGGGTVPVDPMEGERVVAVLDDAGNLLRGMTLPFAEAPPGGRTFLIDTSGATVVFAGDQSLLIDHGTMRIEDGLGGTLPDSQRITKVGASGTELWTRERAYAGDEPAGLYGGLASDSQGNIILADNISQGAMADGEAIEVGGERDVYLEKLSPDGDLLWSRTFGGPDPDGLWALATAPDDSIWLSYWLSAEYDAATAVIVITKLAPDMSPSNGVARRTPPPRPAP